MDRITTKAGEELLVKLTSPLYTTRKNTWWGKMTGKPDEVEEFKFNKEAFEPIIIKIEKEARDQIIMGMGNPWD
jgi:hypothetical protein